MAKFSLIAFFIFTTLATQAQAKSIQITLEWQIPKTLNLKASTYMPKTLSGLQVGQMKVFDNFSDIQLGAPLPQTFYQQSGFNQLIYLVVENTSSKPIRFGVAPHSLNPVEASLDINFKCLCTGHIYEIPANKKWYRILNLMTSREAMTSAVTLKHIFFLEQRSLNEKK